MTYIFLVAGKGTRMTPLTKNYPKTLFKLEKDVTIIGHMIDLIRNYDKEAKIIVVTGFMHESIEECLDSDVVFVHNPFYAVTNSLASLWFAQEYLDSETVIINGDVIVSEELVKDVITRHTDKPIALVDGSIKNDGDYNANVIDDKIVVMSKGLNSYYGEFVGIVKADKNTALLLKSEIDTMIHNEQYDQWYEDALIQLIFEDDFSLYYEDVSNYDWTEIDCVDDLLHARQIYRNDVI